MKKIMKVRPLAMTVLLWSVLVFIILDSMIKFGAFSNATDFISPIFIPVVASLFILADQGLTMGRIGKGFKGMSTVGVVLSVIAIVALLSVIFAIVGLEIEVFNILSAWVMSILGIAVLVSLVTE